MMLWQIFLVSFLARRIFPGLDFRETVPPPVAPETPSPLTAKQQKKRKEAIAAARERIRLLRENRTADPRLVDVHPTYDDETRAITAVGLKVGEIWNVIAGEQERQNRWWATYNAALTGLLANSSSDDGSAEYNDGCRRAARRMADAEHGPLSPKKEP